MLSFTGKKGFQNKFNFIRDIFVILGIFATAGSLYFLGIQTAESRKVASADFVNTIYQQFNSDKYKNITLAIEGDNTFHTSNYPILKPKGQFTPSDVDEYISNFDNVANLWQDGLVDGKMAYNEFDYDAEKAWCNKDIYNYIMESRKEDGNYTGYKAFYSAFEQMTKQFLTIDKKACADLDKE